MSKIQELDHLMKRFTEEGLSGCGLIVTQHGKVLYENYAGYADIENKKPVTADSLFRMASMSKIPMYTTLMMLYERGLCKLSDPVSEYLPEWKHVKRFAYGHNGELTAVEASRPITVGDTLSMRCGMPYCNSPAPTSDPTLKSMQACMKPLWERGHYTLRENVRVMADAVLAFEPGTNWMYGFSSEIAACLIEVLTGKSIDNVMKEFLFDPLGMDSTRSRFYEGARERLVKIYTRNPDNSLSDIYCRMDDKHLPGEEHDAGWARLFAPVRDYGKLLTMLACGGVYEGQRIVKKETLDLMRTNLLDSVQLKNFIKCYEDGYGYGYGVRTLLDPAVVNSGAKPGAFGWTGGFGTWCEASPEQEMAIVYMHNQLPNMEEYYHHPIRRAAYALAE